MKSLSRVPDAKVIVAAVRCLAVISDTFPDVSFHRTTLQIMVCAFSQQVDVQVDLHKSRVQDDHIVLRYTVPTACKVFYFRPMSNLLSACLYYPSGATRRSLSSLLLKWLRKDSVAR